MASNCNIYRGVLNISCITNSRNVDRGPVEFGAFQSTSQTNGVNPLRPQPTFLKAFRVVGPNITRTSRMECDSGPSQDPRVLQASRAKHHSSRLPRLGEVRSSLRRAIFRLAMYASKTGRSVQWSFASNLLTLLFLSKTWVSIRRAPPDNCRST